jgi:hypothetical protein
MSDLGARAVIYRIPEQTDAEHAAGFAINQDGPSKKANYEQLCAQVRTLVGELLRVPPRFEPEPPELYNRINELAEFARQARASIVWGPDQDNTMDMVAVQVEEPYRLQSQFLRLARALTQTRGHGAVTEDDVRLVAKVALDTAETDRGVVLRALSTPTTIPELAERLMRSTGAIRRIVAELERVGLVQACGKTKGGRGPSAELYGWAALTERAMKQCHPGQGN